MYVFVAKFSKSLAGRKMFLTDLFIYLLALQPIVALYFVAL